MGWTSYHASYYKGNKVDKKAECDAYFMEGLNRGLFQVKKSAMIGNTYYAAIETLKRYKGKVDGEHTYEDIPVNERETWAAVFLTSTNMNDYYNFSYKDMDETMCPCEQGCPVSILKLLTPTDSEWANEWRQKCYMNAEKKKAERKNPNSLNNLPVDSTISFTARFTSPNAGINKGDTVKLTKISWGGKIIWYGYGYRWSKKLIPTDYQVLYA